MALGLFLAFASSACTDDAGTDTATETETDTATETDTTTGEVCDAPTQKLDLSLLSGDQCADDLPEDPVNGDLEGVFTLVDGGFQVTGANGSKTITPVQPAIPDGTFVRFRFGCTPGFYGSAGAWILLENLAMLDGMANPSEGGERLWFFMTAGGEAYGYPTLPFEIASEQQCSPDPLESFVVPLAAHVTGAGADVLVLPEQSASFMATEGPHAGAYLFENVNWTYIGFAGGDATNDINLRLSRMD